jgi:hypothetical protein
VETVFNDSAGTKLGEESGRVGFHTRLK